MDGGMDVSHVVKIPSWDALILSSISEYAPGAVDKYLRVIEDSPIGPGDAVPEAEAEELVKQFQRVACMLCSEIYTAVCDNHTRQRRERNYITQGKVIEQ